MPLDLISYDLLNHKTFGQYETLIEELRRIGAQRVLLSEWVLRNPNNAVTIRDSLMAYIHTDDRILITEITAAWAGWKILADINKM